MVTKIDFMSNPECNVFVVPQLVLVPLLILVPQLIPVPQLNLALPSSDSGERKKFRRAALKGEFTSLMTTIAAWFLGYDLYPRCNATTPAARFQYSTRAKPASCIMPFRVSWSGCMRIDSAR